MKLLAFLSFGTEPPTFGMANHFGMQAKLVFIICLCHKVKYHA
jgi:hypothetical protein